MPNRVINGDFEATVTKGTPPIPFWTIISGSSANIGIKQANDIAISLPIFAGNQALWFTGSGTATIQQSFPVPIKASQFSFWFGSLLAASIGTYKLYYADGTTETVPLSGSGQGASGIIWQKVQRYWSPAKYITTIELSNTLPGSASVYDEIQLWEDSIPVIESDQPKFLAYVFRGMHPESEDNWLRGANNSTYVIGTGSASTDGHTLTIYATGSGGSGNNFSSFYVPFRSGSTIDVTKYGTAVVRYFGGAPPSAPIPAFTLRLTSGSSNFGVVFSDTITGTPTVKQYNIAGSTVNPIDGFIVTCESNGANSGVGQFLNVDFVMFCTGSMLDISQDVIDITTKRSTQTIGNFNANINNLNGKYTTGSNAIHYWDDILIHGGHQTLTGSIITYEAIFGGKIEEVTPRLDVNDGEILRLVGQDYGNGLKNILAFAEYSSTGSLITQGIVWPTAGNIMNDVVNRFVNPTQISYFRQSGSILIVNQPTGYRIPTDMTGSGIGNIINTMGGYASWQTGSLLYYYQVRQAPVWQALSDMGDMYFATQTTGSGIMIGDTPIQTIDYYISPARALHFEQLAQARVRGRRFGKTLTAVAGSLNNNIVDFNLQSDVNDLVNKVNYFSSFWLPSTGDQWTEGVGNSWSAGLYAFGVGNENLARGVDDTNNPAVGSFAVSVGLGQPNISGSAGQGSDTIRNGSDQIFLAYSLPSLSLYTFGSPISVPYLRFYHRGLLKTGSNNIGYSLNIFAGSDTTSNFYVYRLNGLYTGSTNYGESRFVFQGNNTWQFFQNIPIGPFAPTGSDTTSLPALNSWVTVGSPNWSNISVLGFEFLADSGSYSSVPIGSRTGVYFSGSIDGVHFESLRYDLATNSTSIGKYSLREEFVIDPLIKDTGSTPLFAKAEILRFSKPIIRGTITTKFYPTAHPAQLATVNYPDGGFYNQDFRVTDIEHTLSPTEGFTTKFTLNSDTGSTHPIHRSDMISSILGSSAVGSQSVTELLNVAFDPFMTPYIVDYPI